MSKPPDQKPAPNSQLTPSPSHTQKELLALSRLLHLTHHHNKNQHRLAKWYKSLSTFRRQVSKLLVEVKALDTALAFSISNKKSGGRLGAERLGKEGKYVRVAREKVEERVRFWEGFCVERWFVSFSNLTADVQYASLGLMLLGCLAKARVVVRQFSKIPESEKNEAEQPAEEVSITQDDLGEVVQRKIVEKTDEDVKRKPPVMIDNEIDIDEEDLDIGTKISTKKKRKAVQLEGSSTPSETSLSIKPKKKKKRKEGDAFDDLFASLI